MAKRWPLNFFDANLLEKLGLPPDHNERLQKGDLSGYNLEGLDLGGAILGGLNLTQTKLKRANLVEAFLAGADLRGAEGLTEDQIRQAYTDENTRLPDYLKHLEKSAGAKPKKE